ncbi:Eukaryotic_translation initiation factor 4A [Hexamita inflata]|uniref:Eukaryotic translation initiation factor 4A n=1 Tax=Hexamita inflata TaxID=28002 RepID=A0AA86Q7I2_9EUKA|nr:Eukaryotic translation initiation factor 4A [Hexamita inflata]
MYCYQLEDEVKTRMKDKWFAGKELGIVHQDLSLKNTAHFHFDAKGKDASKLTMAEQICKQFYFTPNFKAGIFCRTQQAVNLVHKKLAEMNYEISKIDLETDQFNARKQLQDFIDGKTKICITNVPNQKITVQLTHVIVYDVPQQSSPVNYIQRCSHAGRYGQTCVVISFTNNDAEKKYLDSITQYCQQNLKLQRIFTEVTIANAAEEISKKLK